MQRFYRGLREVGETEALHQAQLEILRQVERVCGHPFYWASSSWSQSD